MTLPLALAGGLAVVTAQLKNTRGLDYSLYTIFRPACMKDGETSDALLVKLTRAMAEKIGVEGRGAFYDSTGAIRESPLAVGTSPPATADRAGSSNWTMSQPFSASSHASSMSVASPPRS